MKNSIKLIIYLILNSIAAASIDEGIKFYKEALHAKSYELEANQNIKVLSEWLPLAKNNDVKAQFFTGVLYYEKLKHDYIDLNGNVTNDLKYKPVIHGYNEGIKWLTKSAESGYVDAQLYIGFLYSHDPYYFKINEKEAFKWMEKAAQNGNAYAKVLLGNFYQTGFGVKKNKKEANKLYNEAYDYWLPLADKGDKRAQENIGRMFIAGEGIKKNFQEGLKYLLMSAKQGYLPSIHLLGEVYYSGKGTKKDIRKAVEFFRLGTEYKYNESAYFLFYYSGFIEEALKVENIKLLTEAEKFYRSSSSRLHIEISELEDYSVQDTALPQKINDIMNGKYQPLETVTAAQAEAKPEPPKPTEQPLPAIQSETEFWNIVDKIISDSKNEKQNIQAINYIYNHQKEVAPKLLEKIKSASDENTQNIYLWLLGFTNDQNSAKALIDLFSKTKSENIQNAILMTLGQLGGEEAGKFLTQQYKKAENDDEKFNILDLLAQIKYEPALPLMESILKKDPQEYYWQNNFVFGKYGDMAVPFLIENIKSFDKNIKYNAIVILGKWLMAPEALKPFQELYWKEKDIETKKMILGLMEGLIPDFKELETVYKSIAEKETEEELKEFAAEVYEDVIPKMKEELAEFSKKEPNPDLFNQEYDKLYKGQGHGGDYDVLKANSRTEDEERLKSLREVILQRNSDEAFYDYEDINRIIMMNRFMKANPDISKEEIPKKNDTKSLETELEQIDVEIRNTKKQLQDKGQSKENRDKARNKLGELIEKRVTIVKKIQE